MTHLITSQLVEAHHQCPRKAFLLLSGSPEPQSHEYEIVLEERAAKRRIACLAVESVQQKATTQPPHVPIIISVDDLQATCDAVTPGKERGQREPHLVIGTTTPSSLNKVRLAFAGYALGQESRHRPSVGVVVSFTGNRKRMKLDPLYSGIRTAVDKLREWTRQLPPEPPALIVGKQCQTCEFRYHCHAEAEKADSLFLLDKMTPKLAAKYQKKGIFTLTQLSYVYRPRRRRKGSLGKIPTPFNVELQALAIREKKIYLHERPTLPQHPVELFLDIEGIPDQGFDYLVGVLVHRGSKNDMHSFWADGIDGESHIFKECLALAAKYPDAPIYHYGNYERRAIQRMAKQYDLDCKALLARLVNVNGIVYGKIYFPTRSNRLKDLGAAVGASWPTPNPSGIESVAWRYRWEDLGQADFKAKLLTYNRADCNALRLLTAELQSLVQSADKRVDVDFAGKPKQLSTPTGEGVHRTFDGIIKSAQEEYRRKRVKFFEEDKPNDPQDHGNRRQRAPRRVRRSLSAKRVTIIKVASKRKCPNDPEHRLRPTNVIAQRTLINLHFTRTGCRKVLTRYVGHKVYCSLCNRRYHPPALTKGRLAGGQLYGHSFQAWVAYQRIILHLPYRAIAQSSELLFSEYMRFNTGSTADH